MLVLFSALIAPYFIDWSSYRTAFEAEASRIVGQRVRVRGEADARLLPFPSVTFSDVTVGDAGEPAMTVSRFSMDAELAPFLRGEVLIFDMRVEEPDAVVRILEDGSLDWALNRNPTTPGETVVLENVTITDASITIIDEQNGRTNRIRDIDATVSAGSLSGPWVIEADGAVAGQRGGVSITTGVARDDGSIRMRLRVAPDGYPVLLETEGEARVTDSKPIYDGQFTFTALSTGNGGSTRPERPVIVAKGDFAATNESLEIEEWRAEIGLTDDPYIVTGQATIDTGPDPEFLLVANGQQINMDRIDGGAETAGEGNGPAATDVAPVPLKDRLAVFNSLIDRLPPPPLPGRVELNLPAIVAGDTTLREIALRARPDGDAWQIDSFSSNLPGRTVVEARGRLVTGARASFDGELTVASNQPSGLANWLSGEVDPVIRRMAAAGFSANVSLSSDLQRFEALEVVVGPARLTGRVEQQLPPEGRPSLSVELAGDSFDVDAVRALALLAGAGQREEGLLGAYDVAARIEAETLRMGEYSAGGVETSLIWRNDALTLERLSFDDLAGASGTFSATLTQFDQAPAGSIRGRIETGSADGLFRLADRLSDGHAMVRRLAANAYAFDAFEAEISLELDPDTGPVLSVDGSAGGGDLVLTARGPGWMPGGSGGRDIAVELRNPELYRLLEQTGFAVVPLEGEGPATLTIKAGAGSGEDDLEIDAKLTAPGTAVTINGAGSLLADAPVIGLFDLSVETAEVEPFAIFHGLPLPGSGIGSDLSMTATLALNETTAMLSDIDGQAAGNGFSGRLSFERDAEPISGEGNLRVDSADIAWLSELVLGPSLDAGLAGTDGGTWSSTPFLPLQTAVPEMQVRFEAARIDLGRGGIAEDFSGELTTGDGALALSDMDGAWFGGRIGGDMTLTNSAGSVFLLGGISVTDADLARLDRAVRGTRALSGRLDATVNLEGTGTSMRDLVGSLAGGGEFVARDLVVRGIDAGAFPRILGAADREDFEIEAGTVSAMVANFMTGGEIGTARLAMPFTLTGGVMRFSSAEFTDGDATLSGDARVDLVGLTIESDWRLGFEPGVEAVAGGDPSVLLGINGLLVDPDFSINAVQMSNYLSMRAFERERRKVELLQAGVVEKQRLRREIALLRQRQAEREAARIAAEEEARRAAEEAERRAAEEAAREAEREARRQAEEEAARQAREEAERQAAEEAARQAALEAERQAAEARRAREAEAAAQAARRAEEEAARERARQQQNDNSAVNDSGAIERRPLAAPADPPSALADEPSTGGLPRLRFDDLPGVNDPIRSLIAPEG
ncbi:AsmA family protein [Hoeflea sp.]|uniref:AsmA family protein n=1 Tax=Hoeflea sp. TaxID=1940281 RepID=UPI003BABA7F3